MNELLSVPPALIVVALLGLSVVLPRKAAYPLSILGLAAVAAWALVVPDGTGPTYQFLGFELLIVDVDQFTRLMVAIFGSFGALAVSFAYFAEMEKRHLFWGLSYVGASLWTVTVGDWLGLVVGWEVMAIASTIFVWLSGGTAVRAGYRYALAHAIGGSLLMAGIVAHLIALGASVPVSDPTILHFGDGVSEGLAAVLIGVGIGINAAIIGFHAWLPDTYAAPTAATSVFLCCYTTKTAVYAFYRAFPDGNIVLAYMGGAMAIYGASYALAQKDMRRLLSYHIQAQVGFMLVGIGIGSTLGIAGGFAHLFNHILYKGLLFVAAGLIILQLGVNKLDEFGALGKSAPITLGAFLIGALSITGVPGFNGFVSKAMLADAAKAESSTLMVMLWIGSIGTFASFAKFGYYAFLYGEPIDGDDANLGHGGVVAALAGGCILFGVYYAALLQLLPFGGEVAVDPYYLAKILEVTALAVAGIVFFVLSKPLLDRLHGGVDVNKAHDPLAFYGAKAFSGGFGGLFGAVDRVVVRCARGARTGVYEPSPLISAALPETMADRYDRLVARTPGKTGFKLGIGLTISVASIVLGTILALVLFVL